MRESRLIVIVSLNGVVRLNVEPAGDQWSRQNALVVRQHETVDKCFRLHERVIY